MLWQTGVDWGSVGSVPRPLIALLVGTVAFFGLWITALKPSSSGPGAQHGLGTYQTAINKACSVPGLAHAEGCPQHSSTPTPSTSAPTTPPAGGAASAGSGAAGAPGSPAGQAQSKSTNSAKPGTRVAPNANVNAQAGFAAVQAGLREHKVLALLFYNPSSADDRAVHQELASVPTHSGAVVKLAVPLQELSKYSALLNQVPVNFSPTLVLIDRARQADEIMGFADTFEIAQRVAAAVGGASKSHK
jgi:hypothetical protein